VERQQAETEVAWNSAEAVLLEAAGVDLRTEAAGAANWAKEMGVREQKLIAEMLEIIQVIESVCVPTLEKGDVDPIHLWLLVLEMCSVEVEIN